MGSEQSTRCSTGSSKLSPDLMITVKNATGFAKMAVAGKAVKAIHEAIRETAKPGVTTKELDVIAADVIAAHGCTSNFLNYQGMGAAVPFPGVICASPNEVIVHGIPGDYRLKEGDVLSVDAGAIYEGYHGDAAFTMAIGDVPERVRELIEVTEQSMWAGIEQVKAGNKTGDIGHAVQTVVEAAGFSVVTEYVGHGIGTAMHEPPQVPNYGEPGTGVRLKEGYAICVEPMVNIGEWKTKLLDDGWTIVTADGSLSAHFEHTVALTADGPKVLTA